MNSHIKAKVIESLKLTAGIGLFLGGGVEIFHLIGAILGELFSSSNFSAATVLIQHLVYYILGCVIIFCYAKEIKKTEGKVTYVILALPVWFLCLTAGSIITYAVLSY